LSFVVRMYHDARSSECQKKAELGIWEIRIAYLPPELPKEKIKYNVIVQLF